MERLIATYAVDIHVVDVIETIDDDVAWYRVIVDGSPREDVFATPPSRADAAQLIAPRRRPPAAVHERAAKRIAETDLPGKDDAVDNEQLRRMESGQGFIAALDQSGGSTPKALAAYGVDEGAYGDEAEMFDRVHEMRARIISSPAFTGERVLGTILFEMTLEREVGRKGAAEYLWQDKRVVPIVKVDKGLADESEGARLMKPMPDLDDLLERAAAQGVFGTKMRSVILTANRSGIDAVVDQQLEVARRILDADLVPIIEPEIDIRSPQKAEAEKMLQAALRDRLDRLPSGRRVMLKLTLPEQDDLYSDLVAHPNVLRVFALSGGYSLQEANARLARNHGVAASFSRALTENLRAQQSDEEFDTALDAAIESIYQASIT